MATKTPPSWRFATDRQHWTLRDATDQGFPLKGEWRIKFCDKKPHLESVLQAWRADSAPALDLEIAYTGQATTARILWKRIDDDKLNAAKSLPLELKTDGTFHAYHLDLASSPEYRGLIIGLAIEPVEKPRPGEEIAIKSILLSSPKK
jgi:hypothetical protein